MITLVINRLRFPGNASIPEPITVALYIKTYYGGTYSLIEDNVPVDVDGTILDSPLPSTPINPAVKYMLKAVNEQCAFSYEQAVMLHPYCPDGYDLAPDGSYCFYELVTDATPPSGAPDTLVAVNFPSYSACGSYIYAPGYNVNGTGTSSQISLSNPFWKNGAGLCVDATTTEGPLNRSGVWASNNIPDQDIGFGVCLDIQETKTYYIGIAGDNHGIIKVDGVTIVNQDPAALAIQYPLAGALACFRIWHIYPVVIPAGSHIIEVLGHNDTGPASIGCEIYENTSTEIAAATAYSGLTLIFSSKDYVGHQVQIGTQNAGYTCPVGYSLSTCSSPFECVQIITTPVLFQ